MIPVKLKLSNFTSYGEDVKELDFSKFKLAAISGSNGAGKSSLLDAITWCVWGASRAGDSSDELVRLGQTQMLVEFSFELDRNIFTVKRARSKKSGGHTSLELWSSSGSKKSAAHNLTEGTIKATQDKIINLLHLTYETFINSSFIRQGHADEFTMHGPTDRKRILADILGLDHYDRLEEKAKERSKEAQTKLQLIDYQLPEIDVELSQSEDSQEKKIQTEAKIKIAEEQIKDLEIKLKILQEERAKLVALSSQQEKIKQTLDELKKELEEITMDGKNRSASIKKLEEDLNYLPIFEDKLVKLKDLQKQLEEFNEVKQKRLEVEKNLSEIRGSLNLKTQEQQSLQKRLFEVQEKISNLAKPGAKCPTCNQEIGKDQKHQVKEMQIKELQKIKDELSKINTKKEEDDIKKLEKELDNLNLNDGKYHELVLQLKELEEIHQKREVLIKKQATLESEKKILEEMRKLFINKKSQVEKLQTEVDTLPSLSGSLEKINNNIFAQESKLNTLRTEEKEARNILGQVVGLISRFDQLNNLKKDLEQKKSNYTREKEIYEELSLAFGKKGIQAMIIEAAIPEIEDEANKLLDKLTDGRMKVALITQKETKTKVETSEGKMHATIETLDIIISDEMGERSYELYSGGEAFRVNFAIRLAISKLLAHRAGAKLQFLVIDEGFGTQDAAGRARLVEVIDTIKNDFEKILIITHIEELKEEFPVRIEVSKNSSGSNFEVVGV